MAEAVVSITLETLHHLLLEEIRFLSGVSTEVKDLQTQLKEVQCLLKDADRRQRESESVLNWIAEIKDLAFRSEDAIETYAIQISSKRGRGFKQLFGRFSCVLNEGFSLHQIDAEISNIKSEIAIVSKSMQEYGIRSIIEGESFTVVNSNVDQQRERQTFPFEIEDCFVGKEDELKQLVSLVLDDKPHRVISIWGVSGIGKTTIARKVCNHIETKYSFECFAWVCITQQFRTRSVLKEVLEQLIPLHRRPAVSRLSDRELIGNLCQIQKAKRCLIVLDDVSEIGHWDDLKHAFLIEGSNSKILLTTPKRSVADVGFAFELGLLHIDDGWELLKKKAFPYSNLPDFPVEEKSLQEIGKEIVHKCGCLPLVISLLGGVLSTKSSVEEWQLVNENINTYDLYSGEGYNGEGIEKNTEIHGILDLSYEDLPYYLKPCFLYMGQLREDETIRDFILYRFWIEEGLISHEKHGEENFLMDIAKLYLGELASRCIVQIEVQNGLLGQQKISFKLHNMVRELCLSKGKKEGLCFQAVDYRGGKLSTLLDESLMSSIKTRGLNIHFQREVEVGCDEFTISQEDNSKHVRSVQLYNVSGGKIEFSDTILPILKFKLLRVLVFFGFSFPKKKLPRGIDNLIHLRELSLQECELDELPTSLTNLTYLYTLNLLNSWDVLVPNILKKMLRLRHLMLPSYDKDKVGKHHRLTLEGLGELETLYGFNSLVHDLTSVDKMKNLRSLEAQIHDNGSLSTIIDAMTTHWKKLQFTFLEIKDGCHFTLNEEGLILKRVFTCPNICTLFIEVHIGKLLEECRNELIVSRVMFLSLYESEIEDDPMEILGKLPNLEQLWLSSRSFLGEEMKCHALGFPRLKKLELNYLPNLREWRVEKGAMPLLAEIDISYCSCLKMVPDGLRFIDTLQKLEIFRMPELGKRLLASRDGGGEGEDFDKVRHVPSIVIFD